MPESTERIEIPVEIAPSDNREIKQLLERIERAENQLFKLQQAGDEGMRSGGEISPRSEVSARGVVGSPTSPIPEGVEMGGEEVAEEGGGSPLASIFGGYGIYSLTHQNVPLQGKVIGGAGTAPSDITKYALSKKSFAALVKRVNVLEKITRGISVASSVISSPMGFVSRFIPHIAIALIAYGFVEMLISKMTGPGGPMDIRYKLRVEKLASPTQDTETLAQIRAGRTDIRAVSTNTLRGSRSTFSTSLTAYKSGKPLYSDTLELYSRGGYQ